MKLPGDVNLWMPRDLVERGTFGGADAYPSPLLAIVGSLGFLVRRRRRTRRWS